MKKLFILVFAFALLSAYTFGQSTARTALSRVLPANATYFEYTGVAADTVGTDQDSLFFQVTLNRNGPIAAAARIEVTRTGSTEDYEYKLQGKVFANDSWPLADATPISVDSLNAQSTSQSLFMPNVILGDSAIVSTNHPHFYRIWRVVVAGDGTVGAADKLTINKGIFKFWDL